MYHFFIYLLELKGLQIFLPLFSRDALTPIIVTHFSYLSLKSFESSLHVVTQFENLNNEIVSKILKLIFNSDRFFCWFVFLLLPSNESNLFCSVFIRYRTVRLSIRSISTARFVVVVRQKRLKYKNVR